MFKQTMKLVLLPAAAAVLVACGGGGGSNNLRVGQFVDDPVEGLTYQCAAPNSTTAPTTNVTNALGQFNYQDGQVCTFRVGNVVLGLPLAVPSDGLVTPQDVAGVVRTATSAPSASTIAQFLQSLSEPGVSGKLKISSATTATLSVGQEVQLVGNTGPVDQESLRSLVVQAGKTLVSPAQAETNLTTQLDKLGVSRTAGAVSAGSPAKLLYVSVSSPSASIAAGAALKLTATANMSNGDNSVVSSAVTWSSADTSLATISGDGTVTTLKPGLVKLSASNGDKSGAFELNITDAVLQSLSAPLAVAEALPLGLTRTMSLIGKYSDGSEKTLSSGVTWTVSNDKASVDANGNLTARGIGDVVVTGTIAGVSKDIPLTVSNAVLQSLAISRQDGASGSVAVGRTVALKAIGQFSDNTNSNVANDVTWTVSNDNVSVGTGGVVTTSKVGSAKVSARSGNVVSEFDLTVGPAELASLSISPVTSMAEGLNKDLTLTGTYTDGTTSASLVNVTWSSADSSKVTVATNGNVTGKGVGAVKVTATIGGVSTDVTVTVTEPVAKSLTATPLLISIANGAETVINSLATLTNDAVVAVAKSVNWVVESLGGQAVISITGDAVSLRGTSPGDVKVKGEYQGIFANFNVTVTPVLSGTAATGAPITNAKVFVIDSAGRVPAGQDEAAGIALVSTDANGQYTLTSAMLKGLTGPFMVRVVGQMLTESGDMGPAVFHAVTEGSGPSTVNVTPLTEAHAALALGAQPSLAYGSTNSLQNLTSARLTEANTSLVAALSNVADFSANPNFVSDPLDATPGAAKTGNARKHDATLDQLSVSVSSGKIILADRNQDDSNYATGPRVEIVASTRTVATPSGAISAKVSAIDSERANAFVQRFTAKLAAGCDVTSEPTSPTAGLCDGVTNPSSNVFHANFKDKGMSPWRWIRGWLSDAFETTDLTGVTVSVVSTTLGSFVADDGQRVHRVLLKFSKDSDVVMRQMLVMDDGANVKAYGNQKNFFFYMAMRFNHKADASGSYPYYPKYEQGVAIMLRPWFGSQNDVIFGAHITGPGLPTSRQATGVVVNALTGGNDVNRNGLSAGVEVFDRRTFGCSAYAIDPSVYVERNTSRWPTNGIPDANGGHRWRPDSTTCNPLFDLLRYDVQRNNAYVLPKKGDMYSVTLYLDARKFAPFTSVQPPAGALPAVDKKNSDGVSKSVLPYTFSYALPADAFPLPNSNFNPATFGFPGVTDATRTNLAQLEVGQNLDVTWSRNKATLADGAVFGSFYAGRYMSSYDQWGTFQPTASPAFTYDDNSSSENYGNLLTYNHGTGTTSTAVYTSANCGLSTGNKYRNGSVVTIPQIRKGTNSNFTFHASTTCTAKEADLAAAQAADPGSTYFIGYSNQRMRKQYVSDRGRLVATSDKAQVLRFSDLISREKNNDLNFCSAYKGFVQSRQVYVQLSDVNGRQLMEMREVWWDFPNKTPYAGATVSDRPNQTFDPLYLTNTSVGKAVYNGERGFVHAVQAKQGTQCVPKVW
jgi:hypothetical protein